MNKVILKRDKEKSVLRGHPWIFSGAIEKIIGDVQEGEIVEVTFSNGDFLVYGHYQLNTITVRVLSNDKNFDVENFYQSKIESAWNLRKTLGLVDSAETTIFRLVHGEGDYLSGLIIDYYDGHLVIQCHSIGMYCDIEIITSALLSVLEEKVKSIYLKSSTTLPKEYAFYKGDGFIYQHVDLPIRAKEYNHLFNIDWVTGQKTGFFVDQRENRQLLANYSKDKKVLNTFCYSGGFSIYALQNGAKLVHSLDASKRAIELTEENVAQLELPSDKHESFVADTMVFMKDLKEDYDIIILDPPAFAKHRGAKHNAVQGYKRLNALAIKQIKSGGIIFTFSCSQVIDKELFKNTVVAAAIEAKRKVRILNQLHQPGDHPINTSHPEGEYLKGLVIQVE